jgi:surface protein
MARMFSDCRALTKLDISSFNTQNVTSMVYIMNNCTKLKSLTLGPDFSFIHKTYELSTYSNPWVKQGTTAPTYTSSELMNAYNGSTMAGTYVRINNIRISINKNDESWNTNNIKVALYQNGTEVYSYNQGEISQVDGTITWYDVAPGTYDIYSSKNSNDLSTLVDTGKDIVVSE